MTNRLDNQTEMLSRYLKSDWWYIRQQEHWTISL